MKGRKLRQEWRARAYLVDLDGTLVSGGKFLPGARRMLDALGERVALVSNDAEHVPSQLAHVFVRMGRPIDPDRILLAGTSALEVIARERRNPRVMLLGSPALQRYGRNLGLDMTTHAPDAVVIARDRAFSYGKLALAANAVREGAELIAANPDLSHPGRDGSIVPETGALLAAILACAGAVPYRVIGKPEPALFERALHRLGVGASEAAMIGDNPLTDGAGAARLGIRYFDADMMRRFMQSGE